MGNHYVTLVLTVHEYYQRCAIRPFIRALLTPFEKSLTV